jgi:hypothetical protein
MGDRTAIRFVLAGAIACVAISLSACSASAKPDTRSDSLHPTTNPDYSYLDDLDGNGLLGGRTLPQVLGQTMYDCMVDAGWVNLTLDDDGSFGGDIPPAQSHQYDADAAECQTTVELRYPLPKMSDSAIRERYALELKTRDCLITQGYTISDPPSEQVWIEAFTSSSSKLWLPYFEVFTQTQISAAEEADLKTVCPDPGDRFYK